MGIEEIKLGKEARSYTPEEEEAFDKRREDIFKKHGKLISGFYEEILERQTAEN